MKKKKFRPKSSEGPFSLPLAHIVLVNCEFLSCLVLSCLVLFLGFVRSNVMYKKFPLGGLGTGPDTAL